MKIYSLHEEHFLPLTIFKAWDFFSSAENLPVITPPELNFKIVSDVKGKEIYDGMLIKYKVSPLLKIPLRWKSEIMSVNKPYSFTDKQITGPYQLWQHRHDFVEKEDGVLMKDTVQYGLPFGVLGQLMHFLIVRKKLKDIFNYRKQILNQIFKSHASNSD